MLKNRIGILLATQRSGTNFLRGVLGHHPRLVCFPEVFENDKQGKDPTAGYHFGVPPFWHFFRQRLEADISVGMPENRADVVRDYFDLLSETAEREDCTILVDVKYNSLHHMDHYWRGPTSPPVMLQFFAEQGYPIVHQIREDFVRVAVSLIHARTTHQYVASGDQDVRSRALSPNPVEFHHLLMLQQRNRRAIKGWLQRCPDVLEVSYEQLLSPETDSGLDVDVFVGIEEFLGLEPFRDLEATTKRTTAKPLREVLENYDAIQERLAGTEFECYFRESAETA